MGSFFLRANGPLPQLPYDALSSLGFTAAAAHGVARKLRLAYNGNAFRLASAPTGGSTLDVGFLGSFPYAVDLSGVAQFITDSGGTVYWRTIYDQSGNGNNLPLQNNLSEGRVFYNGVSDARTVLPNGLTVAVIDGNTSFTTQRPAPPNQNDPPALVTTGMPTGNAAISIIATLGAATLQAGGSVLYGGYGMVENDIEDTGDNHMHMLSYTKSCSYNETGSEPGDGLPRVGADLENGVWCYGPAYSGSVPRVTGISKWNGSNDWTVKSAGSNSTSFTSHRTGALPAGRTTFSLESEGAIALGKGGDASSGLIRFYEGMIIPGFINEAAEQAVLNSVYRFYN